MGKWGNGEIVGEKPKPGDAEMLPKKFSLLRPRSTFLFGTWLLSAREMTKYARPQIGIAYESHPPTLLLNQA